MVVRSSKAYKPMERHYNSYNNTNSYNVGNQYYNYANTCSNSKSDMGTAIATQLLNQFFSGFACSAATPTTIAGGASPKKEVKSSTVKEPKTEPQNKPKKETVDEKEAFIKDALSKAGIDYDSKSGEFKNNIKLKYTRMIDVYNRQGELPSDEIIQKRLANYAKGWEFNHFAQLAGNGVEVDAYKLDTTNTEDKAQKYKDFGAQYVEFYDQDGDGKAGIYEIFYQELREHYIIVDKLDSIAAEKKAIETVEKFEGMSFADIENSNDDSKEMRLFQKIMILTGAISTSLDPDADLENVMNIDADEASCFGVTLSSFVELDAQITSMEYNAAMSEPKKPEDEAIVGLDSNKFKTYMQHSKTLLGL